MLIGVDVVRVHFDSHASRTTNGSAPASGTNNGSVTPTHAKAAPEDERRPSSVSSDVRCLFPIENMDPSH
jgi:hypothetical protein